MTFDPSTAYEPITPETPAGVGAAAESTTEAEGLEGGPHSALDPEVAEGAEGATPAKKSSGVRNAIEWLAIIAAALLVAFVIKTYLVQAFYIPSGSMEQTLNIGDRVLVNKVSYHMHDVHRGDIVVFERPPNEGGSAEIKDLIKRVIGLPGDTIEARDGVVYINDQPLTEPYVHGQATDNLSRRVVPQGRYFVMGDNRGNSKDSRVFGPIPRSIIVGRAFIRIWPITRIHLL